MYLLSLLFLVPLAVSDLELAPYTVVEEYEGWEVRQYPTTRWVSTMGTDVMPHDGGESSKVLLSASCDLKYLIFISGILPVV